MILIKKQKKDNSALLSFLTDTILVLVGIFGSLRTELIGVLALAGWFFLELRRFSLRKKKRPFIVYPAIKFSWTTLLVVVGMLAFLAGAFANKPLNMFGTLGYLILLVWWFISLRVYRYYKGRAKIDALARSATKPKKRLAKKKTKKKEVKKKTTKRSKK
ncbi:MAG: hypothetical protein U9Q69_00395 [Nanoarchaeota archaeon]|nr:hypothetical protein [Nanoarchaeota archaeon]